MQECTENILRNYLFNWHFNSLISQDEKNLVFNLLKIDYKYKELWEIEGQSGVAQKKIFNSISFNENNWKLFGASIKFPFCYTGACIKEDLFTKEVH